MNNQFNNKDTRPEAPGRYQHVYLGISTAAAAAAMLAVAGIAML